MFPKTINKTITSVIIAMTLSLAAHAQDKLFPYPEIPDSITNFYTRANMFVSHFWDKCDIKAALKHPVRLDSAFREYVDIMPHAEADTVFASIGKLYASLAKKPKEMLAFGQMAENALYGDSAEYWSDELYLKFIEPIIANKKISKTDKARFEYQADILKQCQQGMAAPNVKYTTRYGATHELDNQQADNVILFFNDPDCDECSMIKLRLDADAKTTELVESGRLKIVSLSPMAADEEWKAKVEDYPTTWEVGATEDLTSIYDLRQMPTIYLLGKGHKILVKNMRLDILINAIRSLR